MERRATAEGGGMRKQVSMLAEFLVAAKELTNEYSELAEITEEEKNQIGQALMARPDRKATAQLLGSKKGFRLVR